MYKLMIANKIPTWEKVRRLVLKNTRSPGFRLSTVILFPIRLIASARRAESTLGYSEKRSVPNRCNQSLFWGYFRHCGNAPQSVSMHCPPHRWLWTLFLKAAVGSPAVRNLREPAPAPPVQGILHGFSRRALLK